MKKILKLLIPSSITLVILLVKFFPTIEHAFSKQSEKDSRGKKLVKVMDIKKTPWNETFETSGTLEPNAEKKLGFKISGKLTEVKFKEGDYIQKNQVLAKLETSQLEIELEKQKQVLEVSRIQAQIAEEKLAKAIRNFEIKFLEKEKLELKFKASEKELGETLSQFDSKEEYYALGGMSGEDFLKVKTERESKELIQKISAKDLEIISIGLRDKDLLVSGRKLPTSQEDRMQSFIELGTRLERLEAESLLSNLDVQRLNLSSIERSIKDSTLVSDDSGVILKKNKNIGEIVSNNPSDFVLILGNIEKLYVSINNSEKEISKFHKGMKLTLELDAFPNIQLNAKIDSISGAVDERSHSFAMRAILENDSKMFKPGMFCRVKIPVGKLEKKIFIPASSILDSFGEERVYIVKANKVFQKKVKTKGITSDQVEVISGLEENNKIVTESVHKLKEGDEIEIRKSDD
ncbi:MAG: efflux RND transporter periplasmic adaptor subunit [Leptospiraceae bacterium]|nr:efflux RND transporter periplasmic adaptor subunit [Leptospiraceae bacterium]